MASFWARITTLLIFTTQLFTLAFSSSSSTERGIKVSTISAAPAVLPGPPVYDSSSESPALSPDIAPQFPSPSKEPLSPSESSLPTIPSSPSPPNPDAVVAARGPGGAMAVPPSSGSLTSTSGSVREFRVLILSGVVLSLVW